MAFRIQVKSTRKRRPAAGLVQQFQKETKDVLKKIGRKGVNNIRNELKKRHLVKSGETIRSVHYELLPHGVKFIAAGASNFLEKGVRKHKMKYLLNSISPVPVDVLAGVFRWTTKKSIAAGSWTHPGFKRGRGFMSSAIKKTRTQMTEEISNIAGKLF